MIEPGVLLEVAHLAPDRASAALGAGAVAAGAVAAAGVARDVAVGGVAAGGVARDVAVGGPQACGELGSARSRALHQFTGMALLWFRSYTFPLLEGRPGLPRTRSPGFSR